MILWAYFDESGHSDDPNVHAVSVAGAVATTRAWTQLEREWKATLGEFGVKELHMKYLSHLRDEYKCWDVSQREKFLAQLLPIMNRHVSEYIGAAMVLVGNWRGRDEDLRARLRDPYYGASSMA